MSVIQRLKKRRHQCIEVDGEKVCIRSLTVGELIESQDIKDANLQAMFLLGCGLVGESSEPEFARNANEPAEAFANRVADVAKDIPQNVLMVVLTEIGKASTAPSVEGVKKN